MKTINSVLNMYTQHETSNGKGLRAQERSVQIQTE